MSSESPISTADYLRKAFEDVMREQGDIGRKVYTNQEIKEATAKAFEKAKFQRTLVEHALLNKTGQNPLTIAKPELLLKPTPMMGESAKIAASKVQVPIALAQKAMPMLGQALRFLASPAISGASLLFHSPSAGQGSDIITNASTGEPLPKFYKGPGIPLAPKQRQRTM